MIDVAFRVEAARAAPLTASPQMAFAVSVTAKARVQSLLLRTFVRIEAHGRAHTDAERARLSELFGAGDVWARSSRSLLWAQVTTVVPSFVDAAVFELVVPCSYDLAAASSRYLHALESGTIPLRLQFSGTAFVETERGLEASPIPWDREAEFALPVAEFQGAVDAHFPGATPLTMRRDLFEALERYRRREGLLSPDDAVERLLRSVSTGGAE